MQTLLGLDHVDQVRHTELLGRLGPVQMLSLARMRLEHFAKIEIWEEAVCVLRLPPRPYAVEVAQRA